jgi:hemoglobin
MNSLASNPTHKSDILCRPDLVKLVDTFYTKVRADQPLGRVFDEVAKVDWSTHLPKLYNFWDSVIFRAGTFRGNPMLAHANLLAETDLEWPLFERWLELFRETVYELFQGENADHIIRCSQDMAQVIHSKIHAIPNSRFDPSKWTADQKARYANYKETPAP